MRVDKIIVHPTLVITSRDYAILCIISKIFYEVFKLCKIKEPKPMLLPNQNWRMHYREMSVHVTVRGSQPVFLSFSAGSGWTAGNTGLIGAALAGTRFGTRRPLQCGRHDFGGKMEEITEVLNALVGQVPKELGGKLN